MMTVWTLAQKELKNYLDSPLGFLVTVPFLLISFFLYFRTAFIFGQASLRPYFDLLPWFLMIIAPALTMPTFTEEKNRKTLEILLAHPISELAIVLSKFLGAFIFYLLILAESLTLTLPLILFSKPDFGLIGSQYLGALFVGGFFLSLGILASSLARSVVGSFLLAALAGFSLLLLGADLVTLSLPQPFGNLAAYLSPASHQAAIVRGLLDPADVIYFLSLTSLFLLGAVYKISVTKISEIKSEKRKLTVSFSLVLVVGALLNLFFLNLPLRLDLTSGRLYSLSKATRNLAAKIDDLMTINLYASGDLPPTAQNTLKQIQDFLEDLKHLNKKIKVQKFSPAAAGQNAESQKAISEGLTPVQFNTIGSSSYQIQQGFLGLSVRYGQKIEALPFVSETQSLEYKTGQIFKDLLNVARHKVAFFPGPESRQRFSKFLEALGKNFNLSETQLDKNFDKDKPELLIILGPKESLKAEAVETVKTFLEGGGKALFLLDKISASSSIPQATPLTTGLEPLLQSYGISANSDLVYDLNLAETIQVSQGPVSYLLPYPFWLKALPADAKFPPTAQITNLNLFWPSSLELKSNDHWQVRPLFKTSQGGGLLTGAKMAISPAQLNQISFAPGKEITLAATATDPKEESPRLTVIGDADFIADGYLNANSPSLSFGVNLVDFLSSNREEIIPIRAGVENLFVFNAAWQPVAVQYGITLGTAVFVGFLTILRLWRRRQGYNRVYEKLV